MLVTLIEESERCTTRVRRFARGEAEDTFETLALEHRALSGPKLAGFAQAA